VLKALNARLQPVEHKSWNAQVAEWKNITTIKNSAGVTPSKVINTLNKLTNGDAIISTEVGQHQMWAAQYYGFEAPRRFITSGGLGTMGFGLGAAIGAQVGNPGRHVINVAGDGSFYMNLNELATISKYEIPVIELVMNNGVLGMVRQWQKLFYGSRFSHTTLERGTDLMKLAQAFGVLEFEISTESDIEPVLKAALESQRPCLINCLLDMDENVLPMVPAGAPIDEPVLDM
jgi:acetolactate synthase-1/2/3 large subunit